MKRVERLAALAAFLLLAACSSLLPGQGPPPRLYQLTPKSTFDQDVKALPKADWQLVVETPFAAAAVNSLDIVLMTSPIRVDRYAKAGWVDRAPLMVQSLILRSFDNTGKIVSVGRETVGLRSDYILRTEIRAFQGEAYHGSKHLIRVRINARLIRMPQRIIVASQDFEGTAEVDPSEMSNVVNGFDEALGRVLKRLVRWTLLTGNEDHRAHHRPEG